MNEEQVKVMIGQALSTHSAALEQKFSTQLTEKDAEIATLKTELAETKQVAQQFSTHTAKSNFDNRVADLIAAGIPAAQVNAVAEVARGLVGQTQKLSNGAEIDSAEALFQALDKLPGEARVEYAQVGQNLSQGSEADPFAHIHTRIDATKGEL